MAKRLFIGGLSYNVTNSQLEDILAQFGTVSSCSIIMDRMSGQSKGFGFIEMSSDEESDKVLQEVNGMEIDGRKVTVNVARPMEDRPQGNFRRDDNRGRRDSRPNRSRGGYGRWWKQTKFQIRA